MINRSVHNKKNSINFTHLVGLSLLVIVFFFLLFSYIQAEWLTSLYLPQISNSTKLCHEVKMSELKYIRVTNFEKYKRQAKIYCVYEQTAINVILDLALVDNIWRVYSAHEINQPKSLIWPIYK